MPRVRKGAFRHQLDKIDNSRGTFSVALEGEHKFGSYHMCKVINFYEIVNQLTRRVFAAHDLSNLFVFTFK